MILQEKKKELYLKAHALPSYFTLAMKTNYHGAPEIGTEPADEYILGTLVGLFSLPDQEMLYWLFEN